MIGAEIQKGRHKKRKAPCSGLHGSGQPDYVSLVCVSRFLLRELDLLSHCFCERRQPILDLELVDLAMSHLPAEPDELDPGGM